MKKRKYFLYYCNTYFLEQKLTLMRCSPGLSKDVSCTNCGKKSGRTSSLTCFTVAKNMLISSLKIERKRSMNFGELPSLKFLQIRMTIVIYTQRFSQSYMARVNLHSLNLEWYRNVVVL